MGTTADCKIAIKNSKTINPILTFVSDWKRIKKYKSSNGEWIREFHSKKFDETVFVVERNFGLEVTQTKPELQWSFEVQPYDQWPDYDTVSFKVFNDQYTGDEAVSHKIKNLPIGSEEISNGMFINTVFMYANFIEMMEDQGFTNMTPELGEKPARPVPSEESCGADECCGGSCSSGFTLEDHIDDYDNLYDNLVEDFWYYEIVRPDPAYDVPDHVMITSKAYWEKYGYLDDRSMSDALSDVLPSDFYELQESIFEYDGDIADAKAALDATGKFQEFSFGF